MASTTDDSRLKAVESAKKTAINNANNTYNNMINQTDAKYNELINASKDYATTQQELQQQNTDFAIEKINQSKEQAEKEGNIKLTSQYAKYQSELLEFDRRLQQFADQQIELDLDDGVKVNYAKFKGLLEMEKDIIGKEK